MYEQNTPMIRDFFRDLNPEVADTVIQAGSPNTMLRVKECLDRGGVVGILADRLVKQDQATPCKFFGELARFPAGTMWLASILKVPVILFFGLYRGGNRYEVHFELFAEESRSIDGIETRRFSNGPSATPTAWNTTAVWRPTTGSTFMTFGKSNGNWSLRLSALFLIWLCLPWPAPMFAAQASPPSEREEGSTGWNEEQLIESLAKNRQAEVWFEETPFRTSSPNR